MSLWEKKVKGLEQQFEIEKGKWETERQELVRERQLNEMSLEVQQEVWGLRIRCERLEEKQLVEQ